MNLVYGHGITALNTLPFGLMPSRSDLRKSDSDHQASQALAG
jgi:hypothetical protein